MSFLPVSRYRLSTRQRHYLLAAGLFLVLGFHVGVWAVQLAELASALRLKPGALGMAVTAAATAGVITLFGGGRLVDRVGRRPIILTGFTGTAAAFVLLGWVVSADTLVAVFVMYGLMVSFIDLGANTVGADFERTYDRQVMTGLHAGFSLGALLGAALSASLLSIGIGFRVVYLLLAGVLAAAGLTVSGASLPPWREAGRGENPGHRKQGVWRIPAVGLAIAVVSVTFFGDGALESFLAIYLRQDRSSSIALTGVGIGGYHLASFLGRLLAARLLRRWGERRVLLGAGLLASAGIACAVGAPGAASAIAGLLLTGLAVAPIVPTALSLAGRSAPGRSGQAVATTTAAGYSAFILSPALIGGIADATTLRTALALLVGTNLAVTLLSARWPSTASKGSGISHGRGG
ncbi:MFS transporter [Actinoallomurus purpureus]|uniref:MFS transporter n=1 Tax=Actinoallomurus purpureus TaxID=478114 RepID=UPI0020925222|nr:MFS transporter [Actinoallomurus purpureus]MCO6010391.1 MFS transporter [Actinoallomurus purpureus]